MINFILNRQGTDSTYKFCSSVPPPMSPSKPRKNISMQRCNEPKKEEGGPAFVGISWTEFFNWHARKSNKMDGLFVILCLSVSHLSYLVVIGASHGPCLLLNKKKGEFSQVALGIRSSYSKLYAYDMPSRTPRNYF